MSVMLVNSYIRNCFAVTSISLKNFSNRNHDLRKFFDWFYQVYTW